MSIEAMKLALFALDIVKIHYTQNRHINEAIAALKERLADPMREVQRLGQEIEQEPVAWWNNTGTHIDLNVSGRGTPLYTTPPQRTWVGLTKQEQLDIFAQSVAKKRSEYEHYKAIEQALKEKN